MGSRQTLRNQMAQWEGLDNPDLKYQEYNPEKLQDTNLSGIQTDPRLRSAQTEALRQLGEYSQTGMNAIDRSRLADINRNLQQQNRAAQEAIMQNAQQRGVSGSGLEMSQRLAANQAATDRAYQQGTDVQAAAQQAALQAIQQRGAMAGQMSQQDYMRLANAAQAQDLINRFNTEGLNAAQLRNIDEQNRLKQQQFMNEIAKLQGSGQMAQALAQRQAAGGQAAAQGVGAGLELVGSLLGTFGGKKTG